MTSLLTESLTISPSTLAVADISRMVRFYHEHVGLDILEQSATRALLGKDQIAIIELLAHPKLAYANPQDAGLFHNAILFSSRGDLSRTVGNIVTRAPQLYSGTGDHLVSEAFYFNDPEGNGLELYFDRPRDTWTWENGQVKMDTLYIDPIGYIHSYASEHSSNDKKIGHVHLKVGDIIRARKFYIDLLGFDITADIGSALFISIGGYHHHIGLNTWLSQGAPKRKETLGLAAVEISLLSEDNVSKLAARLEAGNYAFAYTHGQVHVNDPWGNTLIFTI
jgi:catechol 2,3-dioxygenase